MNIFIAKKLKENRKNNNLSVKEVSSYLQKYGYNIKPRSIYGYEDGSRMPNTDLFLQLCLLYNCKENNSKLKYKMFPIEVKAGKQYKTTSLNNFREKYKNRIGESYIIHPRNLIIKDGIICIPPYMTMML